MSVYGGPTTLLGSSKHQTSSLKQSIEEFEKCISTPGILIQTEELGPQTSAFQLSKITFQKVCAQCFMSETSMIRRKVEIIPGNIP